MPYRLSFIKIANGRAKNSKSWFDLESGIRRFDAPTVMASNLLRPVYPANAEQLITQCRLDYHESFPCKCLPPTAIATTAPANAERYLRSVVRRRAGQAATRPSDCRLGYCSRRPEGSRVTGDDPADPGQAAAVHDTTEHTTPGHCTMGPQPELARHG